jgi:PIN domain
VTSWLVDESAFVRFGRSIEPVQLQLALSGGLHHRSVSIADLLIAAAAEEAGDTVLHYDEDFDRIAAITHQPTRMARRTRNPVVSVSGPECESRSDSAKKRLTAV